MKVPARGLPSVAAQFARAELPGAVCLSRLGRFARVLSTGDHAPVDSFPRRNPPGAGPFRWALIPPSPSRLRRDGTNKTHRPGTAAVLLGGPAALLALLASAASHLRASSSAPCLRSKFWV